LIIRSQCEDIKQLTASTSQLEQAWQTHIPSFLNAVATVPAALRQINEQSLQIQNSTQQLNYRINHAEAQSNNADASIMALWERIEFVRREILFEMKHGAKNTARNTGSATESRIVSTEKFSKAQKNGLLRLNLGCGHIPLSDYLNVDARELPGVDIVADVGALPLERGSVDEIFSAHLVEHFPIETLRRKLVPYWRSRLRPGGLFKAVTPDLDAMIKGVADGSVSLDDFREVAYGAQDYDGDYHFNLFTPQAFTELLREAGFSDISVPLAGRRNGKCFEFEIIGKAP